MPTWTSSGAEYTTLGSTGGGWARHASTSATACRHNNPPVTANPATIPANTTSASMRRNPTHDPVEPAERFFGVGAFFFAGRDGDFLRAMRRIAGGGRGTVGNVHRPDRGRAEYGPRGSCRGGPARDLVAIA